MAKEWTVAQLIDSNLGGWNHCIIDSLFLQFEVQWIKGIPLCLSRKEDCIIWPRCKSGIYSVKLGYQLLCELDGIEEASASYNEKTRNFWRSIWQLRVPNKVKIFLWRACTDALPTKVNLQKRRVLDNTVCSLYQKALEDVFHAMWSYEAIQSIWLSSFSWLQDQTNQLKTILDLVSVILIASVRVDVFAMVAWSVWCRRNKLRCNEQTLPIHKVIESALTMLFKF